MSMSEGEEARKLSPSTFAARAIGNQGEIIDCVEDFKVNRGNRLETDLHRCLSWGLFEEAAMHLAAHPEWCRRVNKEGSLPLHVAATTNTPVLLLRDLIEVYPEALTMKNTSGFDPPTLGHMNKIHKDQLSILCDGRSWERGVWISDQHETERLYMAQEQHRRKADRDSNARAIVRAGQRPHAGVKIDPDKFVFLSAHQSAR